MKDTQQRAPIINHLHAAFGRHQLITLPLMVIVSVLGCRAWFHADLSNAFSTPHDRIYAHNQPGEQLAAVLLGELVLWDIPLTLHPSIYSHTSIGHHIGTTILALLALRCARDTAWH